MLRVLWIFTWNAEITDSGSCQKYIFLYLLPAYLMYHSAGPHRPKVTKSNTLKTALCQSRQLKFQLHSGPTSKRLNVIAQLLVTVAIYLKK